VRVTEPTIAPRIVRCPACGGDSVYSQDNPSRPFCSARCKNNDFSQWASEGYRVESAPGADGAGTTEIKP
jgi:endogenous inhibitor of DNA gyrase (YacG/DUF329 family)